MDTNRVASALTSGLTPRRTLEKITIGSVLEPGPATNCEITTSSHDSVKASSHAGEQRRHNQRQRDAPETFAGRAPRSMRGLFQRPIEAREARLHHHGDIGHGEADVGQRDRSAPRLAASRSSAPAR